MQFDIFFLENELVSSTLFAVEFDNYMQQDAHEFLNFLINHINEIIVAEQSQSTAGGKGKENGGNDSTFASTGSLSSNGSIKPNSSTPSMSSNMSGINHKPQTTWVNDIFQVRLMEN